MTKAHDLEPIVDPKCCSIPFIPEVCVIAGIPDNKKAELRKFAGSITAQHTNTYYRTAFETVGKGNIYFSNNSDGMVVGVSSLLGTLQETMPAS